jgi:hypothetical protein
MNKEKFCKTLKDCINDFKCSSPNFDRQEQDHLINMLVEEFELEKAFFELEPEI